MIDRLRKLAERLETPRGRGILLTIFSATAIALTLIPFVRFLRTGTQFDYRTWFDAGQAVLQGRDIYPRTGAFPFMYPPTCALLLAIPVFFGKAAMILMLSLLNTFAWVLCIRFLFALTDGFSYRTAIVLFSNVVVLVFIWSSYHLGQPSLILLALMLGAFLCLRHRRQMTAGGLIALATTIKAFPILAAPYLVYRRYWLATASLLLSVAILLLVLPAPFRGISRALSDARNWQRGMLRYQHGGIAQRPARSYSWKNQSIFGLVNRLLRRVSVNDEGEPASFANIADLDFKTVNGLLFGAAILLGGSFIVATRVRSDAADTLGFGALLILILMFTPLAFGYLFSWLMLPLSLLAGRILRKPNAAVGICILVSLLLLALTGFSPRLAQIYGSVFFAALALYVALVLELWREKRRLRPG